MELYEVHVPERFHAVTLRVVRRTEVILPLSQVIPPPPLLVPQTGITLLTAEIQQIPLPRRFPKRIFEGKDQAMERNCPRNASVVLRAKSCQMDLELERRRKSKNHLTSNTMPRFGEWPYSLPLCPDSAVCPAALHESPTHLTAYIMQDGGR
jgi:hypothetical protein